MHGEVDYAEKLVFSDDEEAPATERSGRVNSNRRTTTVSQNLTAPIMFRVMCYLLRPDCVTANSVA